MISNSARKDAAPAAAIQPGSRSVAGLGSSSGVGGLI